MKINKIGLSYLFASVYYITAEFISALFFNDNILNTYIYHTISELSIPGLNSPFSILMNSAFILVGLSLCYGNFSTLKNLINKNNVPFYILTIITSIGVIIVGLVHGGNPLTSGYHTLGAIMAILGGNILLVLVSRCSNLNGEYNRITLLLGIIGLIAFVIMFFNMNSIYMPVVERLSVYTLILWSFITGLYLS